MKQFGISESFIEIYDNVLTKKECDIVISQFEKCDKIREGGLSKEGHFTIDRGYKQCLELPDLKFSDGDIISNIVKKGLLECMSQYKKKYSGLYYISKWSYNNRYNFQKYETKEDGFKSWHSEHGPGLSSHRMLAWMIYLNNAKSGTEFMYHSNVNAKRGRCVIWPSGFTHCHRGAPNKGLKYIVTGWVSFDK